MFTTVIFDLCEVLLQGMIGSERFVSKVVGCDPDQIWVQIDHRPRRDAFFMGRMTEREYWEDLIKAHSWTCSPEELAAAMRENFMELPGTRKIIETLRHSGKYKLGLLSIHAREWVEYCEERHGYHQYFDVIQYSYQVGLRKPDPQVFQMILRDLQSRPEESIFVDDNPRNIQAAQDLRITTVHHVSASQTAEELGSLTGIKFDLAL